MRTKLITAPPQPISTSSLCAPSSRMFSGLWPMFGRNWSISDQCRWAGRQGLDTCGWASPPTIASSLGSHRRWQRPATRLLRYPTMLPSVSALKAASLGAQHALLTILAGCTSANSAWQRGRSPESGIALSAQRAVTGPYRRPHGGQAKRHRHRSLWPATVTLGYVRVDRPRAPSSWRAPAARGCHRDG